MLALPDGWSLPDDRISYQIGSPAAHTNKFQNSIQDPNQVVNTHSVVTQDSNSAIQPVSQNMNVDVQVGDNDRMMKF